MKSSFSNGFLMPGKSSGKTNYGDATPADVRINKKFSSASYINSTGTLSGIKSIQQGTCTISGSSNSYNPTISAIVTTQSILLFDYNLSTGNNADENTVAGRIAGSTSVQFQRSSHTAGGIVTISYFVIEFNILKQVIHGTDTFSGVSTKAVTISGVNPAKSFILASHYVDAGITGAIYSFKESVITNSATITFNFGGAITGGIWYQVAEFY